MIEKKLILFIDGSSIEMSEDLILYTGDGNLELNFLLKGFSYTLGSNIFCNATIINPLGEEITLEKEKVEANMAKLIITKEMIDKIENIGQYKIQIHLYDSKEYDANRISLPPFCIKIEKELKGASIQLYTLKDIENYGVVDLNNNVIKTESIKKLIHKTEDIDDSIDKAHVHKNKDILDTINKDCIDKWNTVREVIEGKPGKDGKDGINGTNGMSAYEIAINNGYVGTKEEWLNSLKGPKGDQGIQGVKGNKGDKGDAGTDGINGANGVNGKSAYQVAIDNGFIGSENEWLNSLKATTQSTTYKIGDVVQAVSKPSENFISCNGSEVNNNNYPRLYSFLNKNNDTDMEYKEGFIDLINRPTGVTEKITKIIYLNDKVILLTEKENYYISDDGIKFTKYTGPSWQDDYKITHYVKDIIFFKDTYICHNGANVYTSKNCVEWQLAFSVPEYPYTTYYFYNGCSVFLDEVKIELCYKQDGRQWYGSVFTSIDFKKWTKTQVFNETKITTYIKNMAPENYYGKKIYDCCYGNNVYVAAGAGGNIYTTIDGVWKEKNIGTEDFTSVYFYKNKFIAGNNTVAYISDNGYDWQKLNNARTFVNSKSDEKNEFLIAVENNKTYISYNGYDWQELNSGLNKEDFVIKDNCYCIYNKEDFTSVITSNFVNSYILPDYKLTYIKAEGEEIQ